MPCGNVKRRHIIRVLGLNGGPKFLDQHARRFVLTSHSGDVERGRTFACLDIHVCAEPFDEHTDWKCP